MSLNMRKIPPLKYVDNMRKMKILCYSIAMESKDMVKRRNEIYGADWVRKNAVKAGMANKKKRKKMSHSTSFKNKIT